jgi:nicotinamidase-related amidase
MIDRDHTALLLVDLQYDFMPGGALAVAGGDEILGPIRAALAEDLFGVVVATQDWHPPKHVSFASSHSGRTPFDTISLHGHEQVLWPDHCVAGTPGAELYGNLPLGAGDCNHSERDPSQHRFVQRLAFIVPEPPASGPPRRIDIRASVFHSDELLAIAQGRFVCD